MIDHSKTETPRPAPKDKKPLRLKYKPKFFKLFLLILFLAFTCYILFKDVMHNNRGLIINHLIHLSPRGATVFYFLLAICCTVGLGIAVAMFYVGITTRREILLFDNRISLPKSVYSKKMNSIQYAHIFSLKIRTINKQRALLIAHRDGTTAIAESMLENTLAFERLIRSLAVATDAG